MSRRASLTCFSRRLIPSEVAQHWFRRGADFGNRIHAEYPDFQKAGPDGLYLLASVENWFDRFHGIKRTGAPTLDAEFEEAMAVARGERRREGE